MTKGYLNLILHAHLPFVYAAGQRHHLEERWFFEAVCESYLPLLECFEHLQRDKVPFKITLSLSPTLLAMLDHPVLSGRFEDYLGRLIRLSEREVVRTKGDTAFNGLARFYRNRLDRLHHLYTRRYNRDLTAAFARLAGSGCLELITTCATHGYLPLMKTREAVSAQIAVGLTAFSARFGFRPRGIWLPECGYFPGVDEILAENGVEYTFVDTHGLRHAWPAPENDVYAPVRTKAGVAVFARDPETSSQVWNQDSGYPGDPHYREYYKDIGFELDEHYLREFLPYPVRVNTGLKYWRITGRDLPKEPYSPERAGQRVAEHAADFHFNREHQIEYLAGLYNHPPVITAPYDAELFGHWWFEGPEFIEQVARKASEFGDICTLGTPSSYLERHGCAGEAEIYHSSWGDGGYSRVWLNTSNDWLYPKYHRAERMLTAAARSGPAGDGKKRVLKQMGRELLLAQSSDWAFMINAGTTSGYGRMRALCHLDKFRTLHKMVTSGSIDHAALESMETDASGLFPGISVGDFASSTICAQREIPGNPAVLMLSWEYPPHILGGLARHVDDLSNALAAGGMPVSILTSRTKSTPPFEINNGVCVYRAAPYRQVGDGLDFYDWVIQLNMAYFNLAQKMIPSDGYAILHAHDWLVGQAALAIRRFWRVPLVATIHATEHGRNNGIFTPLQKKIHEHEKKLVENADRVICCSSSMAKEVVRLFKISADKISVVENGVVPANVNAPAFSAEERARYAPPDAPLLFFVGRLVREKGVEVLIKAMPRILARNPAVKAVISGKGPMLPHLKEQAQALGVAESVVFTGFITDRERNRLFASCDVAVFPSLYEPFGIVALEAMAAGVPVVVSDVGGMAEVIAHGKDGLKCPPGNHEALADAVLRLLSNRGLRKTLAGHGKKKAVEEYSWRFLAEKTRRLYGELSAGIAPVRRLADG